MKIDYYAYQSKLKSINAGIKILFAVVTLCLVVGMNRLPVSFFVTGTMGILTVAVGRTPWKAYLQFMMVPLGFMLFGGIVIAVQLAGEPVGRWNVSLKFFYLCITEKSLGTALQVFFKAMAGMSALYMMALSTPVSEILQVLEKLHLPGLLVELMHLIYRYIFILLEAAKQMQTAVKARMGDCNFFRSCISFAGIAGNLFIISLKKAGVYYDALLARGYDGRLEFLQEERQVKGGHVVFCMAYWLCIFMIDCCGYRFA